MSFQSSPPHAAPIDQQLANTSVCHGQLDPTNDFAVVQNAVLIGSGYGYADGLAAHGVGAVLAKTQAGTTSETVEVKNGSFVVVYRTADPVITLEFRRGAELVESCGLAVSARNPC
jgi:hypothetical protein